MPPSSRRARPSSANELLVSRLTTVALGIVAVVLGIVFEKQNIAYMVSLAFAIAASANFPVLFMSVLWKNCTTRGATIGGFLGLFTAVGADHRVEVGLGGCVRLQGGDLPLRLAGAVLDDCRVCRDLAVLRHSTHSERARIDRLGYEAQEVRSETGIGAVTTAGH